HDNGLISIPRSIIELTMTNQFNQLITPGSLPPSLTILSLGQSFNQPIAPGTLPDTLTSLAFGESYNHNITVGVLPASITHLTLFGTEPPQLKAWPRSLLTLVYGIAQPIKSDTLPSTLTSLSLVAKYNHDIIPNTLPPSLTRLVLCNPDYKQQIKSWILPGELTDLIVMSEHGQFESDALPASLSSLTISGVTKSNFVHFPASITALSLSYKFNNTITMGWLPRSLTILTLGNMFDQVIEVGALPMTLTVLDIGDRYDRTIVKGLLPPGLRSLSLGARFNQPIEELPQSLTSLCLGNDLLHTLPTSNLVALKTLSFNNNCRHFERVINSTPSVEVVYIGGMVLPCYISPITPHLKELHVSGTSTSALTPGHMLEVLHRVVANVYNVQTYSITIKRRGFMMNGGMSTGGHVSTPLSIIHYRAIDNDHGLLILENKSATSSTVTVQSISIVHQSILLRFDAII
ncbi:hypothetical protein SAMD00019534_078220, partial [Acytostelium subglobosum LB1]|uniref:hypothetical protein n=1 Tax=Acytostelium subglobosum LB1 TaxID=1410327 RepID=UPI000644ACA8